MSKIIGSVKLDFENGELRKYCINKLVHMWNEQPEVQIKMGMFHDGRSHYFQLYEKPDTEKRIRYVLKK